MVLNLSVIVVRWTHAAQSSGQWGVFLSDRGYCDVTPHLPYLAEIDDGDLFTVWAGSYVFCNIRGATRLQKLAEIRIFCLQLPSMNAWGWTLSCEKYKLTKITKIKGKVNWRLKSHINRGIKRQTWRSFV